MRTEKRILIAFLLNLFFSIFEIIGGIITGSYAILSDAIHDFCDAVSIGISYLCEKGSKKRPNHQYTFGYVRYSVLGAFFTTIMLLIGSSTVIYHAIEHLFTSSEIDYNGMIIFAIIGFVVNLLAALITRKGESLNQKAVSIHMLEDVLGWCTVLIGAIIMRFTGWSIIDPIISIIYSIWILFESIKSLKKMIDLFLLKAPDKLDSDFIEQELKKIPGIQSVHHIHSWSIDGMKNCVSVHLVVCGDFAKIKNNARLVLQSHGIEHITLETELEGDICDHTTCGWKFDDKGGHCTHCHH